MASNKPIKTYIINITIIINLYILMDKILNKKYEIFKIRIIILIK